VSLEDIKSPLPPRKVVFKTETEDEGIEPRTSLANEEPIVRLNDQPLSPPNVVNKKNNKKPFILIGVGLISLILVVLFLLNKLLILLIFLIYLLTEAST